MPDDTTLLRAYLEQKSEAAFTELVHRHLPLVYSVALRRVGGDTHLAQDVAQRVFTDLARKADKLVGRESLTSWLYVSAHHASAAVVRSEQRRKSREQQPHLMPADSASPLDPLSSELDQAIVSLAEADRTAISLRFFEQRSFAEVGLTLRISEEAARKRVDRALDKLRTLLARRGVTSTATALGLALAATGGGVTPGTLSAQIAGTALSQAGASGSAFVVGKALLPLAATVGIGTFLLVGQYNEAAALKAELARQQTRAHSLATLRDENTRLARAAADASHQRSLQGDLPRLRALATTPQATAPSNIVVELTAKGTIKWDNQSVTLREFLARVQQLRDNRESRVVCRIDENAATDAVHYVTEELRRASLYEYQVVLNRTESGARIGSPWF